MARYKKISCDEYRSIRFISVYASYPNDNIANAFCNGLPMRNLKCVAFNLRKSVKEEIEKNYTYSKELLYIDDKQTTDVEYIVQKCHELSQTMRDFTIIIDFENKVTYTKEELIKLKDLCRDLYYSRIIITTDLCNKAKRKKYPVLDDLDNPDLVEVADVIWLCTEKLSSNNVLAKNRYGKTGIVVDNE